MADTLEVAKDETVRQTVILAFSLIGVAGTILLMDYLNTPDMWRTTKMATALAAKRFCAHEAERWQAWADDAATWYNREKL